MAEYRKKFIALDLETTHLDMREGRIMEIGAVEVELKFDAKQKKVVAKFGQTLQSLVNPEVIPSPTALDLTGIAKADLDQAPPWRQVKNELQDFLGESVLVGHNLWFDLQYLKNQGLALKNDYLDTLEIAQTLQPLLPAHALEYLVQELEITSMGSHRALADSQSAALVLAAVLNKFLDFPETLQVEIKTQLELSSLSFREVILDLPQGARKPGRVIKPRRPVAATTAAQLNWLKKDLPGQTLVSLPFSFANHQAWLGSLAQARKGLIVAVSHPAFLVALPFRQILTNPELTLCEKRLNMIKNQENLSDLARKILIKILVFQALAKSLNLGLIKWPLDERLLLPAFVVEPAVCVGHRCGYISSLQLKKTQSYFCDLPTLFNLCQVWPVKFKSFQLVLLDLARTEEEFTESVTESKNLRQIRAALLRLYPLEKINVSRFSFVPPEVMAAANELDLFFGILHLVYLPREGEFAQAVVVDDAEMQSERFLKLLHPAEKLQTKLREFLNYLTDRAAFAEGDAAAEVQALAEQMKSFIAYCEEFFWQHRHKKNYWLKFNAQWVDLCLAPLDIRPAFAGALEKFASATVLDTELPAISWRYFQNRLGLENFAVDRSARPGAFPAIPVRIFQKPSAVKELAALALSLSGPTLVVLPNETKLAEVYEALRNQTSIAREILAYRLSGHAQVLKNQLRRFSPDRILLLTANALLRFFPTLPSFQNLLLVRLPFEAPGRRMAAQDAAAANLFAEHVLPRTVQILHTILSRFLAAARAPTIYLLDPRILTDYNQTFLQYLEEMPDFQVVTSSSGQARQEGA